MTTHASSSTQRKGRAVLLLADIVASVGVTFVVLAMYGALPAAVALALVTLYFYVLAKRTGLD